MKRINALLILAFLATPSVFAQEMSADLTAKLEAKSTELNAGNASAAKSWLKKQINAWETIQNMSFAADEADIKLIKELADKKFPMDYVKQESYINQQSVIAVGLAEYKVSLGKETFAEIREAFVKSGKNDMGELVELLNVQSAAKSELDTMKPTGDEMTFAIAKEVIAKKFPGDFAAQLAAMKKQFAKAATATTVATAAAAVTTDTAAETSKAAEAEEADKPAKALTISDLNKISKDMFARQTFVVEGAKKCTGIAAEVEGRQAVVLPFTAYSPDAKLIIMNNLGEEVAYEPNAVFAFKKVPIMAVFPKTVPADTVNLTPPTETIYRELIGRNVFFVGYTATNIQSFPVKINAIGDPLLTLSTRIPSNFQEGTLLLEPETSVTLGILTINTPFIKEINWKDRTSVNRFIRTLDMPVLNLNCIRIDKLGEIERLDNDRFRTEALKIKAMRALSEDVMNVFLGARFDTLGAMPVIGKVVKKHRRDMTRKQEKSRFERLCRDYLHDICALMKSELKDLNADEFYSAHRVTAIQFESALKDMLKSIEDGVKSNNFQEFIPDDAKRVQEK